MQYNPIQLQSLVSYFEQNLRGRGTNIVIALDFFRIHKFDVPRLPHLREFLQPEERGILEASVQERKGFSYKKMLGEVFTSNM